jgi:hypothetical protein
MSEQPKEPDVIEELQGIIDWGNKYGEGMMWGYIQARITHIERDRKEAIRSRPHPAPETKQAYRNGYNDGYALAMNEAGEKIHKSREDELALLEEWDYHNNRNFGKPHPVFADMIRLVREKPEEIQKHIESLRSKEKP